MDVQLSDFVTIGLLVLLEGLLSADNALVLAILVLGLPRKEQQKQALRYGLLGAFVFRILAVLLAVYLIQIALVKLIGRCTCYTCRTRISSRRGSAKRGGRSSRPRHGWACRRSGRRSSRSS